MSYKCLYGLMLTLYGLTLTLLSAGEKWPPMNVRFDGSLLHFNLWSAPESLFKHRER